MSQPYFSCMFLWKLYFREHPLEIALCSFIHFFWIVLLQTVDPNWNHKSLWNREESVECDSSVSTPKTTSDVMLPSWVFYPLVFLLFTPGWTPSGCVWGWCLWRPQTRNGCFQCLWRRWSEGTVSCLCLGFVLGTFSRWILELLWDPAEVLQFRVDVCFNNL